MVPLVIMCFVVAWVSLILGKKMEAFGSLNLVSPMTITSTFSLKAKWATNDVIFACVTYDWLLRLSLVVTPGP